MLIMCSYWHKQSAPHDDKIHQIARMSKSEWNDIRETLAELFQIKDGVWRHKRIEAELKNVRDQAKKNREAGIKSGETRRRKKEQNERAFNERSTDAERTLNERMNETRTKREAAKGYTVENASLFSQTALDAPKLQNYQPDSETLRTMNWNEGFWVHQRIHSRAEARKWRKS